MRNRVSLLIDPYEVKNKFPPHLKELLTSVAHLALDLNEFDDYFFARLPSIFPYNKFTLTKLVKREVFPKRMNDYNNKQEEYLDVLRAGIKEHYDEQKKEFEQVHADWVKSQDNDGAMKVDESSAPAGAVSSIPAFGAAPISVAATSGAEDSPAPATDGAVAEEDKERESLPPSLP